MHPDRHIGASQIVADRHNRAKVTGTAVPVEKRIEKQRGIARIRAQNPPGPRKSAAWVKRRKSVPTNTHGTELSTGYGKPTTADSWMTQNQHGKPSWQLAK